MIKYQSYIHLSYPIASHHIVSYRIISYRIGLVRSLSFHLFSSSQLRVPAPFSTTTAQPESPSSDQPPIDYYPIIVITIIVIIVIIICLSTVNRSTVQTNMEYIVIIFHLQKKAVCHL